MPCALFSQTAEHSQIQQLLSAGQPQQALQQAQAALAQNPRDPQLQFLQANAQSALGHTQEAEQALTRLTQQYPELPEPYNNLAVIKASQGELQEARGLLEQAIRNNPDYAQAHENLADVLLRIGAQHLQKAQSINPSHARAAKLQQFEAFTSPAPTAKP